MQRKSQSLLLLGVVILRTSQSYYEGNGNLRTAKREDGFDVTELLNSPTWSYPILGLL